MAICSLESLSMVSEMDMVGISCTTEMPTSVNGTMGYVKEQVITLKTVINLKFISAFGKMASRLDHMKVSHPKKLNLKPKSTMILSK